ncbi:M24 family metallopeptidase [Shimia sp.]|jgi:Xaa-Pro aminopeptidase|uniref:M24 family metallopeptidase n=1 Tax=unclassified Shimia TaxID=2630038 RepID=UPI0025D599DD|nr:Xaa-Pro peptidase family protein [Shimia sp.]MCH2068208.1 Xaa-Pro peptidase family protein [Shimia sp.]
MLDRGFPPEKFRTRVTRLQSAMADAGETALLLTSQADIFYTTGFLTRFWESPARPWFVIVPAQGDPIAVIPSIGADLMSKTWVTDIRTWDAPCPGDDGVSLLTQTLADIVPETGTIGLPMGLETHLRMPLGDYLQLTNNLAPRRFVDATNTVQRTREIKSDGEVAKIRAACAVADRAFSRISEYASENTSHGQVFRDFQRILLEEGADWVSYTAGGAGQGGYGDVISPATDQRLTAGDILMLDTGAVLDGYFCDFDRNFAITQADAAAKRAYDQLYQATDHVLATLRPGHKASDVHAMFVDSLTKQGATPGSGRLGHGLGITLTEWPSFTPHDHTELRAGMVLTLEPSVEIAPGLFQVHEENIVLRADGPELLSSRAAASLPILR